jgi:hypothetical protein
MDFTQTALLASIDEVLAALRAASLEPEQELVRRAREHAARLASTANAEDWPEVPEEVLAALRSAGEAAQGGDLAGAEATLMGARETLGGPSR